MAWWSAPRMTGPCARRGRSRPRTSRGASPGSTALRPSGRGNAAWRTSRAHRPARERRDSADPRRSLTPCLPCGTGRLRRAPLIAGRRWTSWAGSAGGLSPPSVGSASLAACKACGPCIRMGLTVSNASPSTPSRGCPGTGARSGSRKGSGGAPIVRPASRGIAVRMLNARSPCARAGILGDTTRCARPHHWRCLPLMTHHGSKANHAPCSGARHGERPGVSSAWWQGGGHPLYFVFTYR